MFIVLCLTHLFSPVGTECLWTCHWYPHIVPTGLRVRLFRFFYKHIALPNQRQIRLWHLSGLKCGTVSIFMPIEKGF